MVTVVTFENRRRRKGISTVGTGGTGGTSSFGVYAFNSTITVTNSGTDTANSVTVDDTIAISLITLISTDDPLNVTYNAGTGDLQWDVGALEAAASRTLQVTVTVTNTVPAGADAITSAPPRRAWRSAPGAAFTDGVESRRSILRSASRSAALL